MRVRLQRDVLPEAEATAAPLVLRRAREAPASREVALPTQRDEEEAGAVSPSAAPRP
jgi:hypothetical protein